MSKDGIDASLGLAFSLDLFKHYRKSGVLQAEIPRMPGIRGRCTAFLTLVDGQIISIYLEDKQKQRHSSDKETLCRLDKEKGPFEWILLPTAPNANQSQFGASTPPPDPLSSSFQRTSIPRVVSTVPWNRLSTWSTQQRDALYNVLMTINGERNVEHIKARVPLPPEAVDELLRILLELNVIVILTQ